MRAGDEAHGVEAVGLPDDDVMALGVGCEARCSCSSNGPPVALVPWQIADFDLDRERIEAEAALQLLAALEEGDGIGDQIAHHAGAADHVG